MRLIDGDDLYRKVVGYNGGAVDKTVAKRLIEQQPTVQRNSTQSNASNTLNALDTTLNALDTIYRQAAIDALGDEPEVWTGKDEYAQGLNNQWHYDRNAIKALPSAQPRRGKWRDYSDEGYVECPFCHSATNCEDNKDELHYCFSCGAELR